MICDHTNPVKINTAEGQACLECTLNEFNSLKLQNANLKAQNDALIEKAKPTEWPPRDMPIFDVISRDCIKTWNAEHIDKARELFGTMTYDQLPYDDCARLRLCALLIGRRENKFYFIGDYSTIDYKKLYAALKIDKLDLSKFVGIGTEEHVRFVDSSHSIVKLMDCVEDNIFPLIGSTIYTDNFSKNPSKTVEILWDVLEMAIMNPGTREVVMRKISKAFEKLKEL
jgi:hypothetical protein